MAEVAEKTKPDEAAAQDSAAPKKKSKKLLIGGIVLLVVVVQAVVTYLLLPRHASSEAAAAHSEKGEHGESHDEHDDESGTGDMAEVPLGDFGFSNGTAAPGSIMHVDFKMSAITSGKQAASLEAQVKAHQARIRQAVNRIVRSSNLEELNDPSLATIKRLTREEINRLLRKSYVIEVVITDFRLMEQ